MLVKVEVRSRQGDLLTLTLEDITNGLIVEEIDGLDPVKATLVSTGFAGMDGEQYQASRREMRNIKIRLGLEPDPALDTVQDLRNRLYKFFMTKSEVFMTFFMINGLTVDISGRVESCVTPMFVKDPTIDVDIRCFDPDFVDPDPVIETGMWTSDTEPRWIDYEGTVETGIKMVMNVNRTMAGFTIYHTPASDAIRQLDFVAPLVAGDVLTISTVPGAKGATLLRSGTVSSILYGVSPQSNWISLDPGTNQIRVYSEGDGVPVSIEYIRKYGGL
jgi:hypothetical protein